MSLFQKSVEKKYLNDLDSVLIDLKYADFQNYFGNLEIQENIRNLKEEEFQSEFIRELFVSILGYTLKPKPEFNIVLEQKNVNDSKKADGAILKADNAHAVIELKSTNTTNLDSIETQAFGYKNHHPKCKYVITSNFEKLRFYIQNAVDHIDFDLFKLTKEQFSLLWLCLAKDKLLNDLPLKIKESSVLQEENITKKLYADYSKFRNDLFENIRQNNPEKDKLLVFKKAQKLLDRFLFIFFAEDRQLLPPNSISEIIKQWKQQADWGDNVRLYDRYKKYFHLLNTGWKGKKHEIFAYNGGLFTPDDVLDSLKIDDDILAQNTLTLSSYNFNPERIDKSGHENVVDVNILGHIFEHSLAAGEHAHLRKRDGIFYTPKYITKYIVENTVGKLCEEKRLKLQITDEEYAKGRKNRKKDSVRRLDKKLDEYRNWLLTLTILDPACGSGAFLNQALDFLINEHRKIDELRAQLFGGDIIFSDITNDILEKNIYGVDLNEESVDIAKLSLWLRTAQKGRKLNTLSNNIKCGNSLIDDPKVSGEKAFNWQNEFPNIFQKKEKKTWHITTATHNSRYSQRMFDNYVKTGEPVWLSEKEEIIVTETISEIAVNNKLNIVAFNICGDHAHMILVCTEEDLPKIVQKIKAMSARSCNIAMGRTIPKAGQTSEHTQTPCAETSEHAPTHCTKTTERTGEHAPLRGKTQHHLWTRKFDQKEITSNEQFDNTIAYIQNNRNKHQLPENKQLQSLFEKMCCTRQHAHRKEYSGGFDVVIGNPPYVQLQTMGLMSDSLSKCGYETFHKGADLYCLFTERGYKLLKVGGMQSFIMPNKWMLVAYGKPLRKFFSKTGLRQILNFGDIQFFEEATTYVCIFVTQKSAQHENVKVLSLNKKSYHGDFLTEVRANLYDYPASRFGEVEWSIQPYKDFCKLEQMKLTGIELKDLPISIFRGILTGYNDAFFIDKETRKKLIAADSRSAELIKPMIRGRNLIAYGISDFEYLIGTFPALKLDIENYPAIKNHLLSFGYERLNQTGEKGSRKKTSGKWFETQDSIGYHQEFAKPKIMYPNMTSVFPFMYDESGLLGNDKSFIITANDNSVSLLFLTSVLNSSLAKLWIWYNCPELQGGTREIRKVYFEHFPVPQANEEQTSKLAEYAKERSQLTTILQDLSLKFQRALQRKFELETLTKKLQEWYLLNFSDFIKELRKKKIKLTLSQEAEWEDYFLQESEKAQTIKSKIEKTDNEIDQMVYGLYGLSEEEIKIAEGN
jgi:type I restriction-modification system DNA methylase subunit/REP element-mobilizing transposase RayT